LLTSSADSACTAPPALATMSLPSDSSCFTRCRCCSCRSVQLGRRPAPARLLPTRLLDSACSSLCAASLRFLIARTGACVLGFSPFSFRVPWASLLVLRAPFALSDSALFFLFMVLLSASAGGCSPAASFSPVTAPPPCFLPAFAGGGGLPGARRLCFRLLFFFDPVTSLVLWVSFSSCRNALLRLALLFSFFPPFSPCCSLAPYTSLWSCFTLALMLVAAVLRSGLPARNYFCFLFGVERSARSPPAG